MSISQFWTLLLDKGYVDLEIDDSLMRFDIECETCVRCAHITRTIYYKNKFNFNWSHSRDFHLDSIMQLQELFEVPKIECCLGLEIKNWFGLLIPQLVNLSERKYLVKDHLNAVELVHGPNLRNHKEYCHVIDCYEFAIFHNKQHQRRCNDHEFIEECMNESCDDQHCDSLPWESDEE
jgi:hypothetical protein